jgi:hypothetical protein
MNKEQRKKVTQDQIERFFGSYYPNWRLHQILTNEKLLKEKFTYYSDIISITKQPDDLSGDSTISQEITNGLYFETISYCVQYIEDLYAIIKAGENKDLFIKNVITYDAGKIASFINQNINEEKACKAFHFPYFIEEFEDKETEKVYRESVTRILNWMKEFKEFHLQYQFFYNQYKHGLTVALRPYNIYNEEQIERAKNGEMNPYLAAFDNLGIHKLKDKRERLNGMVFMPCFTENVRANLQELTSEDNLVRYVFPPKETSMEKIKEIAFKVRDCINAIGNNIMEESRNENDSKIVKMQLPTGEINKIYNFTFTDNDLNTA